MGQNPKCPGYNKGKNQGDKVKYIFNIYSFHYQIVRPRVSMIPRTHGVGLLYVVPTQYWFNVGPASQPIAGSMPVNRLRRWHNTTPTLGLLYT